MPKKKTKAKKQVTTQKQTSNGTFLQITAEELQNIIANALLQAEEQRKQIEQDKQERQCQEWKERVGYKDYSKTNKMIAWILKAINNTICFFKIMFAKPEKIRDDRTIMAVLNLELSSSYAFREAISFLISLCLIAFIPFQYFVHFFSVPWYVNIVFVVFAFYFFYLGSKFRRMAYEVDNIKDNNLIVGLIALNHSNISIVLATLSAIVACISVILQGGSV